MDLSFFLLKDVILFMTSLKNYKIKTYLHNPRFHVCAKLEMPFTSPQNRNLALNVHILTYFDMIFLVIEFFLRHFNFFTTLKRGLCG